VTTVIDPIDPIDPIVAPAVSGAGVRRGVLRRTLATTQGKVAASMLLLIVLAAVFGPYLAPQDPIEQDLSQMNLAPSWFSGRHEHFLGADQYGRDLFSRLLIGLRPSLLIGLGAATLSAALGLLLGVFSGYFGGLFGSFLGRLAEVQLSLPLYVVGLALSATVGAGMLPLFLLLGLWGWATYARTIVAAARATRDLDFMAAAELAGVGHLRTIWRHVVPNVLPAVVVMWSGTIGYVILAESALSFVGLGLAYPSFSLGTILTDAAGQLGTNWPLVLLPGGVLAFCILAFNFFGDALRDALDPSRDQA
jgi:peptide/nickel transport system permease protein